MPHTSTHNYKQNNYHDFSILVIDIVVHNTKVRLQRSKSTYSFQNQFIITHKLLQRYAAPKTVSVQTMNIQNTLQNYLPILPQL